MDIPRKKEDIMEKTCCFTGHRPRKLPFGSDETDERCVKLKNTLYAKARELIENEGVTKFISGLALGVDTFAAEAVLLLKEEFPEIILEAAIPCEDQPAFWKTSDRTRYYKIAERCDISTVLQKRYTNGCMQKRNRYMVDNSDIVIAVWDGSSGGTELTVRYAEKTGKKILPILP